MGGWWRRLQRSLASLFFFGHRSKLGKLSFGLFLRNEGIASLCHASLGNLADSVPAFCRRYSPGEAPARECHARDIGALHLALADCRVLLELLRQNRIG